MVRMKFRTKLLLLLLAGVVGVVSYSLFHKKSLPEVVVDSLVVNTDNTYTTICDKNEEEGLVELIELARTSKLEESWIYSKCEEKWIEDGIDSSIEKNGDLRVVNNRATYKKVIETCDQIVDYHIHLSEEKEPYKIPTPSSADISYAIHRALDFYKKHPDGSIRFKVVSSGGVMEYTPTRKVLEMFDDSITLEKLIYILKNIKNPRIAPSPSRYARNMRLLIDPYFTMLDYGTKLGRLTPGGETHKEQVLGICKVISEKYSFIIYYTPTSEITGEPIFPVQKASND